MSATLTKKQQKALAFRSKQKAKKRGVEAPEDVPEADLDEGACEGEGDDATIAEKSTAAGKKGSAEDKGKKRKREDEGEEDADADAEQGGKGKTKAKKGKGKDGDEGEGEEEPDKKKSKKDIKQRFILFIGNLGFKTTREDVAKHFAEAAGRTPAVRLLTEKPTPGSKTPPKSRGIAFLELANSTEMQACLKLHHSILNLRRINVELTAGGGGKSAARRGKIEERNSRIGGQRERKAEKEAEEAAKNGTAVPEVAGAGGQGWKEDEAAQAQGGDGFKMRNGRRVKVKAGGGNGSAPRKKWEPTGANAVRVGK